MCASFEWFTQEFVDVDVVVPVSLLSLTNESLVFELAVCVVIRDISHESVVVGVAVCLCVCFHCVVLNTWHTKP